jgi:hypothetical protein
VIPKRVEAVGGDDHDLRLILSVEVRREDKLVLLVLVDRNLAEI